MANRAFQDGDVVRLKSGGPLMTVEDYIEQLGHYKCVWLVDERGRHLKEKGRGSFAESTLEKVEPD